MKGKIKFSAVGNEGFWKPSKFDATKQTYPAIVTGDDGNEYAVYVTQDGPHWISPVGTEIEFEVKNAAQPGKRGLGKLPSQGGNFGNKTFTRRKYKTPTKEQAAEAADFAANLFKAVKGRTNADDNAAAIVTAALIERLC